ncbi:MAG: zinc transporter ZntB [Phycisphaerales bacterium]
MADDGGRAKAKMDDLTSRGGLIGAYRLNGEGAGVDIDWASIEEDPLGNKIHGDIWVHLDRTGTRARQWIESGAKLPASAIRGMLEEDPRPRFTYYPATKDSPEGVLFVLRGINFNPEAEPEDMVSVRLWIDEDRVITTRRRRIMSIDDRRQALLRGNGPKESVDVLLGINESLLSRIEPVLSGMDDELSSYEYNENTIEHKVIRSRLADLRRKIVILRRYMAPQRDALVVAKSDMPQWAGAEVRHSIHDSAIGLARMVDHLDEMRDRASAVQDELSAIENEQMSRISMRLTVIAAVFLPANMIAAIWGMNTGGMPFLDHPQGFWIVLGILVVLAAAGTYMARGLLR